MAQTLILNAGSSSLKIAVFRDGEKLLRGQVERIGAGEGRLVVKDRSDAVVEERKLTVANHAEAVRTVVEWLTERGDSPQAIGHRVVHGGELLRKVTRVDRELLAALEKFIPLAPLHQPHNLAPIRELMEQRPEIPQFVGADTTFHHTMPRLEQLIPIPQELCAGGVRRYGFHGLSYEYIARRMIEEVPAIGAGRMVICHLGSGCSLCGTVGGRSQSTTMGFTALEGVPMGTRPGSIDPGVILYLIQTAKLTTDELEDMLYHRSGLTALSGGDADMRDLLRRTDDRAREAVDYFCMRVAREIVSIATAIGGVDGIVFTAGIGERSPEIRERVSRRLEWLGVGLDEGPNRRNEMRISSAESRVPVFAVPTDEEAVILDGMGG